MFDFYFFLHFILKYQPKTFTEFIPNYKKNNLISSQYQINNSYIPAQNYNNPFNTYNNMSNNNNSLYESQIRELNKQLNDEKNKNILLNNQIISLNGQINMYKSQLNEEKNKNQSYINTINTLNAQLSLVQKQLNEEKNKNQSYINTINTINTLNAQLSLVQRQLNEEKNKNQTYINTMNTLNAQISLLQKQLNDEKNKNKNNFRNMNQQKNFNDQLTYYQMMIKYFKDILIETDRHISALNVLMEDSNIKTFSKLNDIFRLFNFFVKLSLENHKKFINNNISYFEKFITQHKQLVPIYTDFKTYF